MLKCVCCRFGTGTIRYDGWRSWPRLAAAQTCKKLGSVSLREGLDYHFFSSLIPGGAQSGVDFFFSSEVSDKTASFTGGLAADNRTNGTVRLFGWFGDNGLEA